MPTFPLFALSVQKTFSPISRVTRYSLLSSLPSSPKTHSLYQHRFPHLLPLTTSTSATLSICATHPPRQSSQHWQPRWRPLHGTFPPRATLALRTPITSVLLLSREATTGRVSLLVRSAHMDRTLSPASTAPMPRIRSATCLASVDSSQSVSLEALTISRPYLARAVRTRCRSIITTSLLAKTPTSIASTACLMVRLAQRPTLAVQRAQSFKTPSVVVRKVSRSSQPVALALVAP